MSAQHIPVSEVPSLRKLLAATLVALLVATMILLAVVLPAEYGIDPLRSGRALGLTSLANVAEAPRAPVEPPEATSKGPVEAPGTASINPVLEPSPTGEAPTVSGTFIAQPGRYQFDSREITLAPGEGMEIKYHMTKGAGLVYSWTASTALPFEFHGEPDVKPAGKEGTDYYESYELDDQKGNSQGHGTFIAPSTGIHGWFWENTGRTAVTLKLVCAGFFDSVRQNRNDKLTTLKPMDPYSLPSHPAVSDQVVR